MPKSKLKRSTPSAKALAKETNKNGEENDQKVAGPNGTKPMLQQNIGMQKAGGMGEGIPNEQFLMAGGMKFEIPDNLLRTPQMFGLADPTKYGLGDKPPLGLPNLMGPEFGLDMRSPNINFLNEQLMKPGMISQRLSQDFGASPPIQNSFSLNDTHDAFAAPRNRKSSFENYFHYLPNPGEDPNNMWKNVDKYRSSQFPMIGGHGIGNFLGFNGAGYNQAPFMLDENYGGNARYDMSQFDLGTGEMRGADPNKRVKKE